MTNERRDRLKYMRSRAVGKPEAARDWFGYAGRLVSDRLGFWRFRMAKRAAGAWDRVLWVAGGPVWGIKRRAKERAMAKKFDRRPARPRASLRRVVVFGSAGVLGVAVSVALAAATIDLTPGGDADHVATAGTSVVSSIQPAVTAEDRATKAAQRAHTRRVRAHRARVAAQRRHRAAVARVERRRLAKRRQLARARTKRVAAARKQQVASTGPSPSAPTPTRASQPVVAAPTPVRSAPAPAPKPQAGVVFDDER